MKIFHNGRVSGISRNDFRVLHVYYVTLCGVQLVHWILDSETHSTSTRCFISSSEMKMWRQVLCWASGCAFLSGTSAVEIPEWALTDVASMDGASLTILFCSLNMSQNSRGRYRLFFRSVWKLIPQKEWHHTAAHIGISKLEISFAFLIWGNGEQQAGHESDVCPCSKKELPHTRLY